MTEDDIRIAMELFGGQGYDDPLRGFDREVPKPRQKPRPGLDAARFPSVGLGTDTDSQLQAIMAANERKAEDKAMSKAPIGEKIRGGLEGARLAMQAPVAGVMMPIAKVMGVPEDQFYKAAFDIPETEYGQIRGGRILQGAEDILGAMSESPLRPFVEKLPFQPFSPASAKAIDMGIEGAGKGLKLARQDAQQAGKQVMEAGKDLAQAARAEFATPPVGAISPEIAARVIPKTKIVDESGKPKLMYHGTRESFEDFDPKTRGAIFATPDNEEFLRPYIGRFFNTKTGKFEFSPGANVRPVYIDAKKPFDFENKDHVESVVQWIKDNIPDSSDIAESIGKKLGGGEYYEIERSSVQRAIRGLGFDGFFVNENGVKNIAVFDPKQIRSATSDPEMSDLLDQLNPEENKAKGGAVTMKKGGAASALTGIAAARQASKAARRQERVDKNLQRWSGSEEKPPVYYHATNAEEDFTVFDPTKSRSQAKAAFFTPEKQFASNWAYADKKALESAPEVKPRVMPSYLRVKKTFDFENPEHVQNVVGRAKLPKAFTPEYVAGRIGEGAWSFIEDREIQKAIKDAGFDSFFTKEQSAKNIGVFNPGDIKSIFNRGSYSEDPDISKAKGGVVLKGIAQARAEARMKRGGEVHLAVGGNPLKGAKSGVGQALKAVKGAQKSQKPAPAAPPPKREFTGSLAPAKDPVRGQTSKELVQMQRKELNDEQKEALEIFKQRYPEFARASKFMTPQEVIKTIGRESNVMQIDQLLKAIPSAKELSSVAKLGDPKRGWYRASTQAIMDVFGPDAPRFASLLAAMSPQTSVESNLINTLNTWKNWTAAGRPTDARAIRQIMGSSVQGTKGEESVLDAWAANASRVLSAEDPLKVTLSGPKVDSFYRNLADDVYKVTNDAWMAGGLGVGQDLFSGSPTAVQLMRGDPGLTPGYIGTSARVREAGQMANMLPSEAQETTWSVYMPLYEKQAQTGLGARDIIQRGLLTPDVIRGTPDFATLLKNPEYARILEESGYGEQLAGLRPTPFSTRGPSLSLSEQREVERAAQRLEELKEGRGRESRAKTISLPKQGKPESAFAYSTYETIPGRGVGHLEGLIEEDIGKRKHFSSRAAAPFRDLQGRDVLQGALGLKPLETRTMTGAYRPEGTVPGTPYRQSLETQPGFASGVEVPLTGGLQVPKRTQQQLTAAEALRGLMTAQRGSPWNVQIPTEKGGSLMAFPERNARIDPEAMRYSASIMPEDIFMADTGQGVAVVPFGKPFNRQEGKLITERLGAKRFVPTKFVGDYMDYSQELTGPQGTGAATKKMFAALDPLTGKQKSALSQAAQKPAGELYELYEQTAKSRNEPTREDLMNFLRILRDKGLPGLTAALASGQALPAEEEARKAGGLAALQ